VPASIALAVVHRSTAGGPDGLPLHSHGLPEGGPYFAGGGGVGAGALPCGAGAAGFVGFGAVAGAGPVGSVAPAGGGVPAGAPRPESTAIRAPDGDCATAEL